MLLVICAGCGFSAVNNVTSHDMAGLDLSGVDLTAASAVDLAGADLAGVDLSVSGGGDMAAGGCSTCNCGQAALLVAIESDNGATTNAGKVLQLGLGTGGTPTTCKTLTANKTLPDDPTAIGWFPPDGVIFGSESGIILVDAVKDLQRWTYTVPGSYPPRSVFALQKDPGFVVGVGFDTQGFDDITQLHILDSKIGMKLFSWDITDANNSPIYLGTEVPVMVQSPLDPTHLMFVSNGFSAATDFPAGDVAVPYDGGAVTPTTYWSMRPTGPYLTTINVVRNAVGGLKRVAWLQHNITGTADGVYYINDDGTGPVFTGPLTCNLQQCAVPFKAVDAVPDPTAANRVITTCSSTTSNLSHVVRIDDSQTCTLLVDGTTLPTQNYPVALSIAEAR